MVGTRRMKNYNKTNNQDVKDTNLGKEATDNLELFKRALEEALEEKICKIEEDIKDVQIPHLSKRYKVEMNRLFSEHVGGTFLPFPEEEED